MKTWLWIALLFAACGTTGSNEKRVDVPRAADERAPRFERNGEAPEAGDDQWLERWFTREGFPAVSTDGTLVVTVREHSDGARGFPNLHVAAWRVSDGKA